MAQKKKPPSKTMSKPKAAPKKKPQVSPEQVEKARETAGMTAIPTDRAGKPFYLRKGPEEFTIGTKEYAEVITEYNKTHNTGWNTHRVPPFVFKNMLIHLERFYNK